MLGGSSGINIAGAVRVAKDLGPGHTVVTVLCDFGTRYQSKLFNPAFLREKGLPVPELARHERGASWRPHSSPPAGWPSIWAPRTSGSPTPPGSCRPPRRDPVAEYREAHIPGAVYFDIDDIAADDSRLSAHGPERRQVQRPRAEAGPRRRGADRASTTITASSPRPGPGGCSACSGTRRWTCSTAASAKWQAEGGPVEDTPVAPKERHFTARQNNLLLRELDQMRANLTQRREQVLDARSAGRFHGREPEPRAGLRSGHLPGLAQPPLFRAVAAGRHPPPGRGAASSASPRPASISRRRSPPPAARACPPPSQPRPLWARSPRRGPL